MKKTSILALFILFASFGISIGAEMRTVEIDFAFTPPADLAPQLQGYRLFKNGMQVCEAAAPIPGKITCDFVTDAGTFDFTLQAFYANGTKSSLSPSFPFTITAAKDIGSPPPQGSKTITYSWDKGTSTGATGYRMYMNNTLLCETADPAATSLSCTANLINAPMVFTVASLDASGVESSKSNILLLNPADFPEVFLFRTVTYSWDKGTSTGVARYKMYMNNTLLCETTTSDATSLSCTAELINAPMAFAVSSVDSNGVESSKSNILLFDPAASAEPSPYQNITFTWDYFDSSTNTNGFRLYYNGNFLYEVTASTARQLTLAVDMSAPTHTFAMTAVDAKGLETSLANPPAYSVTTGSTGGTTGPLSATITPTPSSGPVPLTVSFSGTGSTGDIAGWHWEFGDGTTGNGSVASHTYSFAGTYTATLQVTDKSGATQQTPTTITVQPSTSSSTLPTAVLSSSTAAGNAPLTVSFDGSASTTSNPPITAYRWTFGDGSEATGATTSHVYTTAGTYYAELTVEDSKGLFGKVNTPVIVVGSVAANEKPVAVITATPTEGTSPMVVSFDGSQSLDSDGSIVNYSWNFGDGTTGTGQTSQHTYTSTAVYTVTLLVTDDKGEVGTTTKQIACNTALPEVALTYEVAEVSITSEWGQVLFGKTFSQPVVIIGPPTANEDEPVVVRVRNVTPQGFEIRLQEWPYQDGSHAAETVSYLVMEQGRTSLADGTKVEAGVLTGGTIEKTVALQQTFTATPVVLATITSENETDAVIGRTSKISNKVFSFKLQEQEASDGKHINETIAYIALEPNKGAEGDFLYETVITTEPLSQDWSTITLQNSFAAVPFLFASMQTQNEQDPAAIRQQQLTKTDVSIRIEEEKSLDAETGHGNETTGYLALGAQTSTTPIDQLDPNSKQLTFTWDYTGDEQAITGFRFYLNNNLICETANPSEREITCHALLLNDIMEFTMTSIFLDGSESTPAQTLSINGADYPELLGIKLVTYSWDFDPSQEGTISGFRTYNNEKLACEATIPSARQITCETQTSVTSNSFTVKTIEISGSESSPSNRLEYSP